MNNKKYIILLPLCNREENNSEQTLNTTIDSLKKSGLWESGIDFKLVLHDGGSIDTSYVDKYSYLNNTIIIKSSEKLTILSNFISALKYVKENLQADYIISIEDDILFCKNWIQNVDAWIEKNITDEDGFFSFYNPYDITFNKRKNSNWFELEITKFYGTQCIGFKYNKLNAIIEYIEPKSIEGYERGKDIFLAETFISSHKAIKVCNPCLIQHTKNKSTLNSSFHHSFFFKGEEIDPRFHKRDNENYEDISICTSCMNRKELLFQALDTWVILPVREIIIVDWSSRVPLVFEKILNIYRDPRIKIVRVNNKKYFNLSKARNLGIRYSTSKYILASDSDIKLSENFFDMINLKDLDNKCFFHGDVNIDPPTHGTCLITREMFNELNGYNELMNGWGYDDKEFYTRCRKDYTEKCFQLNSLKHIDHEDIIRTSNYEIKDKWESASRNRDIVKDINWKSDGEMEKQKVFIYSFGKKEETRII